jgi:type VI secretion system secreted protein Hcp
MAAVDYFLKIDGVQGESKADKHKNEIDVQSFSWGATQTGTFAEGGGGGAGKVSMQDFHFTMGNNTASPALFLACAQGAHIPKAVLTCRKAGKDQQEYLKVTLSDIMVSSFQTGAVAGGDIIPTDQVSLNFAKIEVEYKEQDASGKLTGSVKKWFDLKSVKGG